MGAHLSNRNQLEGLSRVKLVSTLASGDADRSHFTVPQVAGWPVNFWLGNSEYFRVIFYQSMITWENCMKKGDFSPMALDLNSVCVCVWGKNVKTLYVWWMLIPLIFRVFMTCASCCHAVDGLHQRCRISAWISAVARADYNIQRNCFFLNFSKAVVFFSKTPGNREVFNFQGFQMNMWCEHSFFQEACGASTALLAQLFSPENNGETRPWSFLNLQQHPGVFWQHIGEWHRFQKIVFLDVFWEEILFNYI